MTDFDKDNFQKHIDDTMRAGDGENNLEVVKMVIEEGPARFRELVEWGTRFDLEKDGDFYKYTTPEAVPGLNIIFKDGAGWGKGDSHQTVDIKGIVANTDYEIVYSATEKATVKEIK